MTHHTRPTGILNRALVLFTSAALMALTTLPANCDDVQNQADPNLATYDHAKCNGNTNRCKDGDCGVMFTVTFKANGKATISPFGVGIEISGDAGTETPISSRFASLHEKFVQCKTSNTYCKSNTCRSNPYVCGHQEIFQSGNCTIPIPTDSAPDGYINGCKKLAPGS